MYTDSLLFNDTSYTFDMRYIFYIFVLLIFPFLTNAASLQEGIKNIIGFINTILFPFLIGIGFLFVVINAIRYFVIEGTTDDGKKKAKNLAIYGVLAFVVIIIFWGTVNLLAKSIGLSDDTGPEIDYIKEYKGESPVFKPK